MPTAASLEVKPSLCFLSAFVKPYSVPSFQSRSSNPNSTQCYLISPKISTCHTHYLWSWKPNTYIGRSVPKSVSQNQVLYVCEEGNSRSHLVDVLESVLSLPWLRYNHSSILLILLPKVWPPWLWLDCKWAFRASLKDVDFIPWALWNRGHFFSFKELWLSHTCVI